MLHRALVRRTQRPGIDQNLRYFPRKRAGRSRSDARTYRDDRLRRPQSRPHQHPAQIDRGRAVFVSDNQRARGLDCTLPHRQSRKISRSFIVNSYPVYTQGDRRAGVAGIRFLRADQVVLTGQTCGAAGALRIDPDLLVGPDDGKDGEVITRQRLVACREEVTNPIEAYSRQTFEEILNPLRTGHTAQRSKVMSLLGLILPQDDLIGRIPNNPGIGHDPKAEIAGRNRRDTGRPTGEGNAGTRRAGRPLSRTPRSCSRHKFREVVLQSA